MRIVFEVHGEVQIQRRLLRFSEHAADASPVWEVIYAYLLAQEQHQFDSEGESSGHTWAALQASTVAAKQRQGLRPEILRATDELKESLTNPDDVNQLKVITPSTLAFGSMLPYAVYHQMGTSKMPQRRPVDLTERNKVAILKSVQLWLARGIAPTIAGGPL